MVNSKNKRIFDFLQELYDEYLSHTCYKETTDYGSNSLQQFKELLGVEIKEGESNSEIDTQALLKLIKHIYQFIDSNKSHFAKSKEMARSKKIVFH